MAHCERGYTSASQVSDNRPKGGGGTKAGGKEREQGATHGGPAEVEGTRSQRISRPDEVEAFGLRFLDPKDGGVRQRGLVSVAIRQSRRRGENKGKGKRTRTCSRTCSIFLD